MMPPVTQDALDEMLAARTRRSSAFARQLTAAEERRNLVRALRKAREKKGLSETSLAAKIGTSAAAEPRMEAGGDFRFSMLVRYSAAGGVSLHWKIQ